ncbi:MAG TPA: response regulator [Polyangia bacterium]|nr:response regulator [Polyangia bacterium]
MLTVLVVDDEEGLLEVIADVIAALGYVPVTAHDGAEALARAREHRPDLILSDHMMPRLTGLDLLRQVRADPELREVPFILMSAATPNGADQATQFLSKPVDLDTLERAIRGALDQRLPERAPGERPLQLVPPVLGPRRDLLLWIGREVRTPLAAARLNAEVLSRQIGSGDVASRNRAQALVGQLTVLNETLASLMDLAELMDCTRMPVREEDLTRLAGEVADEWRSRLPDAVVNLHAPAQPLVAPVDRERIRHVMNTLVANSFRRTGARGTVDLAVGPTEGGAVLRMTASDVVPPSLMNHPIDPDQLATSGVQDLSVLPLYVAAVIARAHHGTLVVNEEPDQRSTFSLRLPGA